MAGVLQQAVEPLDIGEVAERAVAGRQLVHVARQQSGADPARGAEAAALVGEEAHEVGGHLERIPAPVEDHQRAGGGQVLEADAAVELVLGQHDAGRAAELYRQRVDGAGVVQHLAHADAERVFIDPGPGDVAGHRQQLAAAGGGAAVAGEPGAAVDRDQAAGGQGLDVVDHGRPAEIAVGDRERRADARRAAPALQGFEQRALLAADVGTGAEVDLDVEVEAIDAADAVAEQAGRAPRLEHRLQRRQQVAVLAAQVEEALVGADRPGGQRHALEHRVGHPRQQHPVLEGAGLALVGVAHHHPALAGGVAAGLPLARGGKAGAAAPAQARRMHLVEPGRAAAGLGRGQRLAGDRRRRQQDVATADVVGHREPLGRPRRQRLAGADAIAQGVGTGVVEGGQAAAVDQHRRPLVAHADARGGVGADQAVLGQQAGLDPQVAADAIHQPRHAQHAVDDVVREQQAITADRTGMQEAVEAGHALDARPRQAEAGGEPGQRLRRQMAEHLLQPDQHLQQVLRPPVAGIHGQIRFERGTARHRFLPPGRIRRLDRASACRRHFRSRSKALSMRLAGRRRTAAAKACPTSRRGAGKPLICHELTRSGDDICATRCSSNAKLRPLLNFISYCFLCG